MDGEKNYLVTEHKWQKSDENTGLLTPSPVLVLRHLQGGGGDQGEAKASSLCPPEPLTSEFWPLLYSSGNVSSVSAEMSLSRMPKTRGGKEVKKRLKNIICQ